MRYILVCLYMYAWEKECADGWLEMQIASENGKQNLRRIKNSAAWRIGAAKKKKSGGEGTHQQMTQEIEMVEIFKCAVVNLSEKERVNRCIFSFWFFSVLVTTTAAEIHCSCALLLYERVISLLYLLTPVFSFYFYYCILSWIRFIVFSVGSMPINRNYFAFSAIKCIGGAEFSYCRIFLLLEG